MKKVHLGDIYPIKGVLYVLLSLPNVPMGKRGLYLAGLTTGGRWATPITIPANRFFFGSQRGERPYRWGYKLHQEEHARLFGDTIQPVEPLPQAREALQYITEKLT
jgi:hypothetical protein